MIVSLSTALAGSWWKTVRFTICSSTAKSLCNNLIILFLWPDLIRRLDIVWQDNRRYWRSEQLWQVRVDLLCVTMHIPSPLWWKLFTNERERFKRMVSKLKYLEPRQLDYGHVPEFRNLSRSNPAKAFAQSHHILCTVRPNCPHSLTLWRQEIHWSDAVQRQLIVTCRDLGRKIGRMLEQLCTSPKLDDKLNYKRRSLLWWTISVLFTCSFILWSAGSRLQSVTSLTTYIYA